MASNCDELEKARDEEINENSLLQQYFQEQEHWLKTIKMCDIPPSLKYEIAILFFISTENMEWKVFLYELGVNYITIHGIECKSMTGVPALYIAFSLLHQKSFGEIIQKFSERKHFKILRFVKPFVEDLVSKQNVLVQPSAPKLSEFSDSVKTLPESDEDQISSSLQRKCISSSMSDKPRKHVSSSPSILVFIQHSLSDKERALKLRTAFRKNKFQVISSADVFPLLRTNHAQILKALNEKVDFIVPIISDDLWKQISCKKTRVDCEEDLETVSNRFVYDLVLHEYFNTLKNYRVRPVIDRLKVTVDIVKDPILSRPFQLWNEVPALIENLNITKKWF